MAAPGTVLATDANARQPHSSTRSSRRGSVALVGVFLAILVAPTVASLVRWEPCKAMDEKRPLAVKPVLAIGSTTLRQIPTMAQAWERYFGDHFGLRKLLIGSYRLGAFHLLRSSENPSVLIGQSDGERRWLYFDPSGEAGLGFDGYLGKRPYTPAQLALIAEQLGELTAATCAVGVLEAAVRAGPPRLHGARHPPATARARVPGQAPAGRRSHRLARALLDDGLTGRARRYG